MLKPTLLVSVAIVLALGCAPLPPTNYVDEPYYPAPPEVYAGGMFAELSDYGFWIHTAPYGWVWQPDVATDWRPNVHGHWVWSDYGWTWISYEPYGWAVYHYGTWAFDTVYGWVWLPDFAWHASRVDWIVTDDWIYWRPIGPPDFYYPDPWDSPYPYWIGCPPHYIVHHDVHRYVRVGSRLVPKTKTKVIRSAPERRFVQEKTKKRVKTVKIKVDTRRVGDRDAKRIVLPPEQQRRKEQYVTQTKKKVTKPKTRSDASRSPKADRTKTPSKDRKATGVKKRSDSGKKPAAKKPPTRKAPKSSKGSQSGKKSGKKKGD